MATGSMLFVDITCDDDIPFMAATQLLAVAQEKDNHSPFFEALQDEISHDLQSTDGEILPVTAYSKLHGEYVTVYICTGVFLQDQPERRKCAGFLAGNSNIHSYFGLACNFSDLKVPFEACIDCQEALEAYVAAGQFEEEFDNDCDKCLCWSVKKLCKRGEYKQPIRTIPDLGECELGYDRQLHPRETDFGQCMDAWDLALVKHLDLCVWTESHVKQYLYLFLMSDATVNVLLDGCRRWKEFQEALDEYSPVWAGDDDGRKDFLTHCRKNPGKYGRPECPAIWRLIDIGEMVETPMHLGMNAEKLMVKTSIKYCSMFARGAVMVRRFSDLLEQLQEMRVPAFPAMKFRDDRFGGYVAENHAAMAQVYPWLSRVMEEPGMKPVPRQELPDPSQKHPREWNMTENKLWLHRRGIPCPKTITKAQLFALVQGHRMDPQCPPESIEAPGPRDEPPSTIRRLMLSAHEMFAVMFADDLCEENARHQLLALVMIFMSRFDAVDLLIHPNPSKRIHIAKYNTLGLLRCPNDFLKHRLIKNLHEGGIGGEGIVRPLRSLCPCAVRAGWTSNLLDAFFTQSVLRTLKFDMCHQCQKKDEEMSKAYLHRFHRYQSRNETHDLMANGSPLSVLVFRKKGQLVFGSIRKHERDWYLDELSVASVPDFSDPCGFSYFAITPTGRCHLVEEKGSLLTPGMEFHSYAYLLPDKWTQSEKYSAAIITEKWEHFNGDEFRFLR